MQVFLRFFFFFFSAQTSRFSFSSLLFSLFRVTPFPTNNNSSPRFGNIPKRDARRRPLSLSLSFAEQHNNFPARTPMIGANTYATCSRSLANPASSPAQFFGSAFTRSLSVRARARVSQRDTSLERERNPTPLLRLFLR